MIIYNIVLYHILLANVYDDDGPVQAATLLLQCLGIRTADYEVQEATRRRRDCDNARAST